MSDALAVPPPPPPPPPVATTPQFDFARPFTFVFEDPQWLSKILLGAVFTLAGVLLFGIFIVYGYAARLVRQIIEGTDRPLPDWSAIGDYFVEGLKLFLIGVIYMLPIFCVFLFIVPFSIISSATDANEVAQQVSSVLGAGFGCLVYPFSLLISLWLPAALLRAVALNDFGAAFQFGAIWAFIRANFVNYILAWLVSFVVRMVVPIGFLACCVGIFPATFWAMLVGSHAFAQTWRLATVR